jgi:peptidyl-prolyl cis-trans isomerase SurA
MTEKLTRINRHGRRTTSIVASFVLIAVAIGAPALAQAPQTSFPTSGGTFAPASNLTLPPLPARPPITPNGTVIEDLIARVNDQIITRSEYQAAEDQLLQEAHQNNISEAELEDHLHDLLRDMIDEQLLLSKGKELGITGDAETMRELDDIRKKNNLGSMEDLQKAAAAQGVSFEDFKQHIRDQIIRQQVVQQEVGRHLNMTHAEEQAYYTAHAQEFTVPEQVHLSEILVPTPESATDAQIAAAQAQADGLEAKLKSGTPFADLARTSSGGPTAAAGGELGDYKRGGLGSDILENATFSLPAGGNTAPIRTRQGFVILHVDSHQAAGVPPLSAVEDKVQNALYFEQLQPALRAYLTKARADAYMETAPGFIDTGSARKATAPADIAFTAYKAPPLKKKIKVKQRVEQERADRAQAELAAARERLAQKEVAKAEAAQTRNGTKNVSKPYKPKKTRREKIRYGQAPEKALPTAPLQTASVTAPGAPVSGQAPGVAMAPTESVTSITTGTGADADDDPLAAKDVPHKKTRFADQESAAEEATAKARLVKAEAKATTRPVPATPTEDATEKHQAAPLGLNGDTTKKPKKEKRKKGEVKERMQDQTKPADTPTPVAPTVNPDLAVPSSAPASSTSTPPPPQ